MVWGSCSLTRLFSLTAFAVSSIAALAPISIKGTKLYDEDGNQFFVKGKYEQSQVHTHS